MSSAPPPLKKRKKNEPEGGLSLGPPALDLSDLDIPEGGEDAAADDPKDGEWLFKQDDVVLGPVSAAVLIQRIEQGELEPDTPVGREAGKWKPLKSVGYFAEILERAEKRKRAIAEQKAREARQKRQRLVRLSTAATIAILPILLGAVAGRTVMIARPWDTSDEWLQKPPPLVDLPPKPKAPAPPPPAEENKGDDDKGDDEKADEQDKVEDEKDQKRTKRSRRRGRRSRGGSAKADKTPEKKPDKKPAREDKVLDTLTQKQVMAGLGKGKGGIGRCLKAEMARNPEMPPRITLMFTIKENGRATNFKLKQRSVRTGPLATCMNKVVSGLRWPKFTGERKNVELPLSVKR